MTEEQAFCNQFEKECKITPLGKDNALRGWRKNRLSFEKRQGF